MPSLQDEADLDWLYVEDGLKELRIPETSKQARRFRRDIMVPPGTHEVSIRGGCGEPTIRVDVPAEGPVPPLALQLK